MSSKRKIGPALATLFVANSMIGSGILFLPASLGATGSITVVTWLLATAGALVTAWVISRLSQEFPRAAGPCAYAEEAMGPFMGFQASFLYWVSCWLANIAIAIAAIGYLTSFFPALATPTHAALAEIALIWMITLLNVLGPRIVCQINSFGLVIGLAPILFVAIAGWAYFDPHIFTASWNVSGQSPEGAVIHTLAPVFWAFLGLESAAMASAVVENPARNVPIATIGGVAIASVIYIASCSAVMGIVPASALVKSTAPFADAMRVAIGPTAGAIVAFCAIFKAVGTLGGWVLITAEIGRASAGRRQFPMIFGGSATGTAPVSNLLIMAVIMSAAILATVSPTLRQQFELLIDMSVVLTLLIYLYACVSVWHFRLQSVRFAAGVAIPFCLFVISQSGVTVLALAAALVFLSFGLYPFVLSWRSNPS